MVFQFLIRGIFTLNKKYDAFVASLNNKPKFVRVIGVLNKYSLLFHALHAVILCFLIEWISRHSFTSALSFATDTPARFLYNSMLIFVSLLLVYLVRFRSFLRLIISLFWLILGIINGVILSNRVTPFNFTDFKMVNDLLAMENNYFTHGELIGIIVAIVAIAAFLVLLFFKIPKYNSRPKYGVILSGIIVGFACIPTVTSAAISSNLLADYFGNLAQGYEEYGFLYSFCASVVDRGMNTPDDYTKDSIDKYLATSNDEETSISSDEQPNIIFIQLETFVDPDDFNFLSYSEDPTPNFHALRDSGGSGYLTVPVVGAGTANTEFEVLTGMSIEYFGLGEYPYKTILKSSNAESIAADLSTIGYSTHAVHNNGGNFYGRSTVFSNLGFDTYTSKELMNITEYNALGTWAKDDILTGEILKCLDSTEDQSDYVYTITVESHGTYADYEVFEDPKIEVSGGETEEENYQWEYYINELHEVDKFIGELISSLDERDEDTIVVMYGDHLPTMGLTEDDMASGNLYNTSYVTWNNFGLDMDDVDLSTYELSSYITEQLGIHEGTIFTYEQANASYSDSSLSNAEFKDGLELLQYDLLYGKKYAYNGEDLFPATDLEMGVEDVIISDIIYDEDESCLKVYGDNFTNWSYVYINDEKQSTTYVTDHYLVVNNISLDDGDAVVVNQVGSKETIFRSSNQINYAAPITEGGGSLSIDLFDDQK